ncbi:hypothetical protein C0Q44_08575 [Paenibacillus sp. PCH8]|uniref:hypothetical protein n=1 Tax=Paenibacillus sp. PCH8 TaxID=2066524 RepID=UPI000CF8729E|nr:hypothetical protein [Paenibacillus sp. PCH8]PQP84595.1 hypothetical protein C0Q44_08575 [Paenibacillus sp. PCH8]
MMSEQIHQKFIETFKEHNKRPIALYGLGITTRKILELHELYNFVGIVANERIGEVVYGKEVMSIDSVMNNAKLIIIVSQMKSVKTIYNRIKHAEEAGLEIYDLTGENLSKDHENEFFDEPYWKKNITELKNHIDRSDIVSFDLWDTLIMRKVLHPDHIFDIVESKSKPFVDNLNFSYLRVKAEQTLIDMGYIPNLTEIYEEIQNNQPKIDSQLWPRLMELEIETERKYSIKRESIVYLLDYAREQGKRVYLIFETSLTSPQIQSLLENCFINVENCECLISNEIRKTTRDGSIYKYFNEIAGTGKKMHIGNRNVDKVKNYNIEANYLATSYELWSKSSIRHILPKAITLNDSILLGVLASKAFNDPFVLSSSKGKMEIKNLYELGYYCFAGLTIKFLTWLTEKYRFNHSAVILFASRDGYLLHQLYEKIRSQQVDLGLPEGIYFYISRRAVNVACIHSEKDIANIVRSVLDLSRGKLNQILGQRLGIDFDPKDEILNCELNTIQDTQDSDQIIERVLEYKQLILSNALKERVNYLKYIDLVLQNKYNDDREVYFFDLYTKGTSFHNLKKLLSNMKLICFDVKDAPMNISPIWMRYSDCLEMQEKLVSLFKNFISFLKLRMRHPKDS